MRLFLIPLALLVVTGCTSAGESLSQLKTENPTHDDFKNSLASEYLAYGEALLEQQHPLRAARIAKKGLAALQETTPPPPEEAPTKNNDLVKARDDLLQVLTQDMQDVAPQKAARTQMLYDCWALQADRLLASDEALCTEAFRDNLAELQAIAELLVHGNEGKHVIHFAAGSSALSDDAKILLDATAGTLADLGQYDVDLMAYSRKNPALSKKRILAIEKALIKRGINAGQIHDRTQSANKAVFLSSDEVGGGKDSVAISIRTYGQVKEGR